MKNAESKKRLAELENKMSVETREGDCFRARSVTVGTSFGGTTEIMMRGNGGNIIWAVMQPVEVIELIHQLAANVGCHINLAPRNDFGSWRDWKYTEAELSHYRGAQTLPGVGWPPHVNDMAPHMQVGANLPPPEQQPGLNFTGNSNGEAVAIKEPKQRRKTKRTAAAS